MSELLPCPFCDGRKITYIIDSTDNATWYSIACESCGANAALDLGKSGAIEKWNTRSAVAERDAAIARAVQAERQLSDAREVVNGLIAAIVMDSKDNNSISGYTGARLSDARAWEKRELERTAAIRARGERKP